MAIKLGAFKTKNGNGRSLQVDLRELDEPLKGL